MAYEVIFLSSDVLQAGKKFVIPWGHLLPGVAANLFSDACQMLYRDGSAQVRQG